jgi:nitrogen fixation protein FixH
MTPTAPFDPRRGRWIPYVFVGLMLLVVVVNGGLVVAALTTFAGTTTGRAYDRGRAYNQVIEEAARQAALGWTARVALAGDRLSVSVTDREGLPVPGHLEGVLLRPLEGTTRPLALASTAPGQWAAEPGALAPGQWEARLTLTGANGAHLDIRQRVLAP